MYIGSNDSYFSSDPVGAFALFARDPSGTETSEGSIWEVRNALTGTLLHSLPFGSLIPGDICLLPLKIKYTGSSPVQVLGFRVVSSPASSYEGRQSASIDSETILSWGTHVVRFADSNPLQGLRLSQFDLQTQSSQVYAFRHGVGDSPLTRIPFLVKEEGLLLPDNSFEIELSLGVPSNSTNLLDKTLSMDFGIEIDVVERLDVLSRMLIVESEACHG